MKEQKPRDVSDVQWIDPVQAIFGPKTAIEEMKEKGYSQFTRLRRSRIAYKSHNQSSIREIGFNYNEEFRGAARKDVQIRKHGWFKSTMIS